MKADPFQIGDVLKNPKRFVVPIYQRTYSWNTRPQLESFFSQVEAKAEEFLHGTSRIPHYMGAILLVPREKYTFGRIEVLDVVDGQQRLTTFQLFLAALRDLAKAGGDRDIADILTPLLLNPDGPHVKDQVERYKLCPAAYDRKLFCNIIDLDYESLVKEYSVSFDQKGKISDSAELMLRGYCFLRQEALNFITTDNNGARNERLRVLSAALLEGFQTIVITLDEDDDAQVIFETLNTGGEPLAAMDLVRNDIFHRAARGGENIEALMERRWSIFEDGFWKAPTSRGRVKKPRIDFFLSDTLVAEGGRDITLTDLYARYKAFVKERRFESVDSELETLVRYSPTYRRLEEPSGKGALASLALELELFDVSTAYPLIFVFELGGADESERASFYKVIVSYIVRRTVCGMTAKAYNNVFPRILSDLRENGMSLAAGVAAFARLDAETVRFPTDAEFREALISRRLYNTISQRRLQHILSELERAGLDKFDETTTLRENLTIEHILPESWTENWPLSDGTVVPPDKLSGMLEANLFAIKERDSVKHTLGNLTLLTSALNPSIGNQTFSEKRLRLATSRIKMNNEIARAESWDELAIMKRGADLATRALGIWPSVESSRVGSLSLV